MKTLASFFLLAVTLSLHAGTMTWNGTTRKTEQTSIWILSTNGTAAAPGFAFYQDQDTGMFRTATNAIGFSTAGTLRLTIDASGNLVIGATSLTPTEFGFLDGGTASFETRIAALIARALTAGVGLSGGGDLSADRTFTLDLSELTDNQTFWSGVSASRTITYNLSGTDPVFTAVSGGFEWTGTGKFSSTLSPVASDGAALGSGTLMWADLFLASGGIINLNNGDVLITHSANTVTITGGNLIAPIGSSTLDASGFNGNLATTDDTIQKVAQKLDDLTAAGGGDVTAASAFGTDDVLIKSDGTGKGVQATGISVDGSNNMTGVGSITGSGTATTVLSNTNGITVTNASVNTPFTVGMPMTALSNITANAGVAVAGDLTAGATNVAGALALKAPLASPVFTGNPTGPTPAADDNDTSLATTAFFNQQLTNGAVSAQWNGVLLKAPNLNVIHDWIVAGDPDFDGLPSVLDPTGTAGLVNVNSSGVAQTPITTLPASTYDFTGFPVEIGIAASDETTAITTGTAKVTFRVPFAFTLTDIRASVGTAPTGSAITIDVNMNGTTLMTTTKVTIDATEETTQTAANETLTTTAITDDAEITIDFDQVGSSVAGTGVKVWLIGTRTI